MSWHRRYLNLAKHVASWSKDPSTQVGAVIVRPDKTIASLGFNGFPRGVADDERLLEKETKYAIVLHAEVNALLSAREPVAGYTLYVWPFHPCSHCAAQIIQAGIKTVVTTQNTPERWAANFELANGLFREAGVDLVYERSF